MALAGFITILTLLWVIGNQTATEAEPEEDEPPP
jgi:hypothetical protein